MAVKQVRVSDLSGQQAGEEQFAKLIVHEHPQYQGPITLDVLPEEIGELPESEQYVSIEVILPGRAPAFSRYAPDVRFDSDYQTALWPGESRPFAAA